MMLPFDKYHGAGNDFILIDNRKSVFNPSKEQISHLCHRRLGIGADGLMLLGPSAQYDFSMKYYNSDGGEGSMCGNGGRCITAFARQLGIITTSAAFEAIDGVHSSHIISGPDEPMRVSLGMKDVSRIQKGVNFYFLDTGSPHHVVFMKDLKDFDVVAEGKKVRYGYLYPGSGTNVDFAEIAEDGIFVRTYERGVEDETLSCGTGVTAVALAYATQRNISGTVNLHTRGGELSVHFIKQGKAFTGVRLEGPVAHVYTGQIEINDLS